VSFNEILRELRESKGLRQEDLASIIMCSRSTLSQYELGNSKPDVDTLLSIMNYFQVSADYLLGKSNIPKQNVINGKQWMIFPDGLTADERNLVKDFALMLVRRKRKD